MQALQPHLKEIQEKYKDDRQRMQREQMALFQEHGVNPLSACLPLLFQFPVFIALYALLRSSEFKDEVGGTAGWLFVRDLDHAPDRCRGRRADRPLGALDLRAALLQSLARRPAAPRSAT